MEYMFGGTISDSCIKDEQILRSYTRCIVSALHYVHSKGIVHCDVKGKNVLVGSKVGVAKLADFGSARRIARIEEDAGALIKPQGTPLWMAPEVIRQEKQGFESDIWSLGCTIIEMITGKAAWKDCDSSTVVFKIGFSDELPEFPEQLSELGCDFLDKCLRRNPSERWTCDQLLQHPFLSSTDILVETSPRSILDWDNVTEFCDDDEDSLN
ncbi:kinase-like, partial [Thalictrum thalictroides]